MVALFVVRAEYDNPSTPPVLSIQFCEVRFGGIFRGMQPPTCVLPEWGSMCSAVFIIYCGMHILLFWVHDSAMLRLIAAMFCVNGIASFFYHMTALRSWGESDGNSMVFLAWLVVAYVWDEFIETCSIQREGLALWNQRSRRELPAHYWRVFVRRATSAVIWVSSLAFSWWLCQYDFRDAQTVHAIAVAAPLVLILAFAITLTINREYQRQRRREQLNASAAAAGVAPPAVGHSGDRLASFVDDRVMAGAHLRLWLGLLMAVSSAALWVVTEQLCDTVLFFRLFPGHLIWHVGMTLGLTNCLVLAALLRADNFAQHPRFINAPGVLGSVYFAILPGLVFLVDQSHMSKPADVAALMHTAEKDFEGGDEQNEADLHLGGDPLLLGFMALGRALGCGGVPAADPESAWTRRVPPMLARAPQTPEDDEEAGGEPPTDGAMPKAQMRGSSERYVAVYTTSADATVDAATAADSSSAVEEASDLAPEPLRSEEKPISWGMLAADIADDVTRTESGRDLHHL